MSLHFSANQYDGCYRGSGLGNWEVGKCFREHPRQRKGATKVIVNDRGHLLPSVGKTQASPWGPLTQNIDPNFSDQQRPLVENVRNTSPDPEDEKTNTSDEDVFLKITGAGYMSGRGSDVGSDVGGPPRSHEGSATPHHASTPSTISSAASFRKRSKFNPSISSSRVSRRSSGAVSNSSSVAIKTAEKALEGVSKLTTDTVEDALLPRRPEEELTQLTGSRALAIRLVDHPAPTNCTKYVILRPNTAPSPAPATKPPLLPKRPKTAKIIRKVPEIEFALKWDLKENDITEENEDEDDYDTTLEVVKLKNGRRQCDSQTPRSVSSVDSGIHAPKAAWTDGPDTRELTAKLENLNINRGIKSGASTPEPESGYVTPKSSISGESLPSVRSSVRSKASSARISSKPEKTAPRTTSAQKISIDSQKLSQECQKLVSGSECSSSSMNKQRPKSRKESSASSQANSASRESNSHTSQAQERKPPTPKQRDPLEIMETRDSVFHTVPLRDTGRSLTQRSQTTEKRHVAATTQTEDPTEESYLRRRSSQLTDVKMRHNHPKHIRSRNCLACEARALEDPPKKFQSPSVYKPAFRAGKPNQQSNVKKPRYVRQSDRYNARLKARHQPSRLWQINTLSSPFCNRPGYGQDQYPDHMRLRSTYGMANATSTAVKPSQSGRLITKLYL